MSSRSVPIFYEDDRSGIKLFGLHELVVSCIADVWERDWWELRGHFDAVPMKGDAKLLAACEQDVPNVPDPLIFAIFDADKLHRRLFASGKPTEDAVLAELRRRCPDSRLHIFLLEQNTETVVNAAADCIGAPRPHKNKLERDRILNRAQQVRVSIVTACVRPCPRSTTVSGRSPSSLASRPSPAELTR